MALTRNGEMPRARIGLLFMGRQRPGFDPAWGEEVKKKIKSYFVDRNVNVVIPSDHIDDEKTLRHAIQICRHASVEVLVVAQPTLSDGRLAPLIGQLWPFPLVLWATPERPVGEMVSSNSLVGTHIFAATLRQMNRRFELLIGWPPDDAFAGRFTAAINLVSAAATMKTSRVGLVGYHAPGFIDLHVDGADLSRLLGIELVHFSVNEFLQRAMAETKENIERDLAATASLGLPIRGVAADKLEFQSKFYLAIKSLMETHVLSAIGVRCWPDLPDLTGQWPYLAIARLVSEGTAAVSEGDVDGAIGILIATRLGYGPVYVSDWLEHDSENVTIWHTGSPPLQMCDPVGQETGPTIALHFNNKMPTVVEATIRAGMECTVYRLWRCDGNYHMAAFEGVTAAPSRHLLGVNGVVRSTNVDLDDWFDAMVHYGMPHHVCVAPGHFQKLLRRFARLLDIEWHV